MSTNGNPIQVFGGSGFVGSAFVDLCRSKNMDTIVSKRDSYECFSSNVVYFISTVDNYNVYTNPHLDIDTNLTVLIKVLENYKKYVEESGDKEGCFNFISSWFVYGTQDGPINEKGVTEESPCNPKGFYSITKRTAEQLLESYCNTFGLRYRILRLANVIGVGDKKASKKKNFLTYAIKELVAGRPINLYWNGEFYRDYIDVRDAARAILMVHEEANSEVSPFFISNVFNISNGEAIRFGDLISFVMKECGLGSRVGELIKPVNQPAFHRNVQVRSLWMNNEKIKTFGYQPLHSIYQTLLDIAKE